MKLAKRTATSRKINKDYIPVMNFNTTHNEKNFQKIYENNYSI
jgi:beta-galactosidase GanA